MANTYPDPFRLALGPVLGERIRQARRGRGLRDTARRAGISAGHLCLLEQGVRAPSGETVAALNRVVSFDDDLLGVLMEVAEIVDEGREERRQAREGRAERLTAITTRSTI